MGVISSDLVVVVGSRADPPLTGRAGRRREAARPVSVGSLSSPPGRPGGWGCPPGVHTLVALVLGDPGRS